MGTTTSLSKFDSSVKQKTGDTVKTKEVKGAGSGKSLTHDKGATERSDTHQDKHGSVSSDRDNTAESKEIESGNNDPRQASTPEERTTNQERHGGDEKEEGNNTNEDKDQNDRESQSADEDDEDTVEEGEEGGGKKFAFPDSIRFRQPSGVPRNMRPNQRVYDHYARRSRRRGSNLDEIEEVMSANRTSSSRSTRSRDGAGFSNVGSRVSGNTTGITTGNTGGKSNIKDDQTPRSRALNYSKRGGKTVPVNAYTVGRKARAGGNPTKTSSPSGETDKRKPVQRTMDIERETVDRNDSILDNEDDEITKITIKRLNYAIDSIRTLSVWLEDSSGTVKHNVLCLLDEMTQLLFGIKHVQPSLKLRIHRKMGNLLIEEKVIQRLTGMFSDIYRRQGWIKQLALWKVMDDCKYLLLSFTESCQDVAMEVCQFRQFLETVGEILHSATVHKRNVPRVEDREQSLMFSTVGIVYNCTACVDTIASLRKAGILSRLAPLMKTGNIQLRLMVLGVATSLATESTCDIISQQCIVSLLQTMADALRSSTRNHAGWTARDCGALVFKLSRHDNNKRLLYDSGAVWLLTDMAETGDSSEQLQAVKALRNLTFDDDIKRKIVSEIKPDIAGLLAILREWTTSYVDEERISGDSEDGVETENKLKIREECDGALWNLRRRLLESAKFKDLAKQLMSDHHAGQSESTSRQNLDRATGQVVISYQAVSAEVVGRIRDFLTDQGYVVTSGQYGNAKMDIINTMRRNVDSADVIVLCVSERYKDSAYCRTEAEYILEKRSHVVTLDTDPHYQADGWLLKVVGEKPGLDFCSAGFINEKLNRLLKAIHEEMVKKKTEATSRETSDTSQQQTPVVEPESPDVTQSSDKDETSFSRESRYSDRMEGFNSTVSVSERTLAQEADFQEVLQSYKVDSKNATYAYSTPMMDESAGLDSGTSHTPSSMLRHQSTRSYEPGDSLGAGSSTSYIPVHVYGTPSSRGEDEMTSQVRRWSKADVNNWVLKHRLSRSTFGEFTGDDVALLLSMYQEAPEAFYHCLQDWLKIRDLPSASKVVWALRDILQFDKDSSPGL